MIKRFAVRRAKNIFVGEEVQWLIKELMAMCPEGKLVRFEWCSIDCGTQAGFLAEFQIQDKPKKTKQKNAKNQTASQI